MIETVSFIEKSTTVPSTTKEISTTATNKITDATLRTTMLQELSRTLFPVRSSTNQMNENKKQTASTFFGERSEITMFISVGLVVFLVLVFVYSLIRSRPIVHNYFGSQSPDVHVPHDSQVPRSSSANERSDLITELSDQTNQLPQNIRRHNYYNSGSLRRHFNPHSVHESEFTVYENQGDQEDEDSSGRRVLHFPYTEIPLTMRNGERNATENSVSIESTSLKAYISDHCNTGHLNRIPNISTLQRPGVRIETEPASKFRLDFPSAI